MIAIILVILFLPIIIPAAVWVFFTLPMLLVSGLVHLVCQPIQSLKAAYRWYKA